MTITLETIIKAAKAAGLDVRSDKREARLHLMSVGSNTGVFDPLHNDTDNAMIRRGAEISVQYSIVSVAAIEYTNEGDFVRLKPVLITNNNKAQAEREAVILCAAAKFDAMNEGVK